MDVGAPELLIILLLFGFFYCTVYAIVRAAKNSDVGWIIGIVCGWLIGLGWIVGLVYLLGVDRSRRGAAAPHRASTGTFTPAPPPLAPGAWHPDPTGRFAQRYWDGTRWTEHVHDGAAQRVDPL